MSSERIKNPQTDHYPERDLKLCAYLLSCEEVAFLGTKMDRATVFLLFAPYEKVSTLISAYFAGKAPNVQPRTLLEALENARTIVFKAKDEARGVGVSNGGSTYEPYR